MSGIEPALRFNRLTDERLRFAKQVGAESVIVHPYDLDYLPEGDLPLSPDGAWSFEELLHLRTRVEDAGLRLGAIENFPISAYEDVMLGREGSEEILDRLADSIENMGRAGIPILGYHWMPNGVWRTSLERPGRGGALALAFDSEEVERAPLTHDREYGEEELWANYERFLERLLPVAEEAGVTLALHPDDPPVESLGGLPRLFRNREGFERAMSMVERDNHALEFCAGTWAEMGPEDDLVDVIRAFGDRIAYVHLRNVRGTVPDFEETFIDEGDYDAAAALKTLREVGFEGMVIPDHVPRIEGERDWGPSGRAYTVGYVRGVLDSD